MSALSQDLSPEKAIDLLTRGKCTAAEYLSYQRTREDAFKTAAGRKKEFAIKESPKGMICITLPGMAFPAALAPESVSCLLDHVDDLRVYYDTHGQRLAAARAAYRESPEYAASIARLKQSRAQHATA